MCIRDRNYHSHHGPKIRESDTLTFKGWPDPRRFREWKQDFLSTGLSGSGRPTATHPWILEIETAEDISDLPLDYNFESLEMKIETALSKILNGDFARQIRLLKEEMTKLRPPVLLLGRQLAWKVFQHFNRPEVAAMLTTFRDLDNIKIRGNDLKGFLDAWKRCLLHMQEEPADSIKMELFLSLIHISEPTRPY